MRLNAYEEEAAFNDREVHKRDARDAVWACVCESVCVCVCSAVCVCKVKRKRCE